MSSIKFQSNGRNVSREEFFNNIRDKALDIGLGQLEERVHGKAASIVDPETGKHADVFVVRTEKSGVAIHTKGSPAFARLLEERLGVEAGTVKTSSSDPKPTLIYLAHASEDHGSIARPLAEFLMSRGIDVWLDAWEIKSGDSLKRKMEEGLGNCTHFVVLLSENSLGKAWVEREIDAGFMKAVEGRARFVGLRVNTRVEQLSVFLQTLHCPAFDPSDPADAEKLVGDILEVSRRPPLGEQPRYVKTKPADTGGWSTAAFAVAKLLVESSKAGCKFDPQINLGKIVAQTGLPEEDARLGILDLTDAGMVEESREIGSATIWPLTSLFNEFDGRILDFDNAKDALALAQRLINDERSNIDTDELRAAFPDFTVRRLNSALNYLEGAKAVEVRRYMGGSQLTYQNLRITDRTRRFVRNR